MLVGGITALRLSEHMSLPLREIIAVSLSAVFIADYVMSHFVLKLVKTSVELSEADDTEAISKEVRMLLSNRSVFYRRFADAYPEVIYKTERIAKRMEEIQVEMERLRQEAEERVVQEDASPEIRELKREVESKKAVLQKRRALFPKL